MTDKELYSIYARWTGQLHWYLAHIGQHLDVEYLPDDYTLKLYEGYAQGETSPFGGVPILTRPSGELSATFKLLRPEDNPTTEDLEDMLRTICFAAARILNIDISPRSLLNAPERTNPRLNQ
jgi:hypothetical protein